MNGRKLFREYAQSKGKEAKEFVKIENEQYQYDNLITNDGNGRQETTGINYRDMINWIIKTFPNP
jgi:cytidylate kinase